MEDIYITSTRKYEFHALQLAIEYRDHNNVLKQPGVIHDIKSQQIN